MSSAVAVVSHSFLEDAGGVTSRLEEVTQPELRARTQLILEHAVGLRLAVQVRDEDRAAGHLDGLRRLVKA